MRENHAIERVKAERNSNISYIFLSRIGANMDLRDILNHTKESLRSNSPTIFTGAGIGGIIATAYLSGRASWRASRKVAEEAPMTTKEIAKFVWKEYIPAAVSGVVTIGCVVMGARTNSKRAAAAYSLLAVSEKAFTEYRGKVVEEIGAKKEQVVRDKVAQDKVNNNPPGQIVVAGTGQVLCCELFTGRYFMSDMETLRRAENQINYRMRNEMWACLSDFYPMVGLPYTSSSDDMGWIDDRPFELKFTTVMSQDGRPCIAFDYNYIKPR